jgi:hypothetical protein
MQDHFGVHSKQSVVIHDTLGEFRVGRLPKQEVNRIVVSQLDDRLDLVQDYESIANPQDVLMESLGLHHREQSAPSTPLPPVSPGFLQPQHQPRLVVPLWNPIQLAQQKDHPHQATINPELLRGSRSKSLSQQPSLCLTMPFHPHHWPIWALQYHPVVCVITQA